MSKSDTRKEANQRRKVTKAFSDLIQAEIDSIIPEESMSTWLDNIGIIKGSETDDKGNFVLFVEKENGRMFRLVMTPIKWEKTLGREQ